MSKIPGDLDSIAGFNLYIDGINRKVNNPENYGRTLSVYTCSHAENLGFTGKCFDSCPFDCCIIHEVKAPSFAKIAQEHLIVPLPV